MPPLKPLPARDLAAGDGWALRARDLVGASSYSPLPLATSPVWVDAGDPMPDGCDCVIDADCVDQTGPILQALAEATTRAGRPPDGRGHRRGKHLLGTRAACSPARSVDRAGAGARQVQRAPPAAARRRYSGQHGRGRDGATDRRERARSRCRSDLCRSQRARCGISRKRARFRRMRSAGDDRRHRGRSQ